MLQKIDPPPSRHININPLYLETIRQGLRDAASQPGGTSADVFGNFHQQVYGKTGTAQYNGQQDYAWYACFVPRTATSKPIVVVVSVEQGGFGAVGAAPVRPPDPLQVVLRQAGPVRGRKLDDAVSATPIQPVDETAMPRARSWPLFDPLLLLAALGLVACSLVTLKSATTHAITGQPFHYVDRQALFAGIGLLLALILSRIDYSRLREYKYGLFAVMIALNLVVYGMPAQLGARRWIPLPLLNFQSSEFGKILIIVALAGFAVDRSRRLHERRTTARIMLLALIPALLVIPQPDLGTGMVYVAVGFSILFFAGTSFRQLAGLIAMFAASIAIVLAGAPALGVHLLKPYQVQRLTGFLNPSRNRQLPDLSDHRVADRDRLGPEDGSWQQGHPDQAGLPSGQRHGLRVRGRRRDLRIRRSGGGAVAVCAADLARSANPHDVQEPVRHADRRRHPRDAHVPDLRERRNDDRDHAHHGRPVAAAQLWRLLGDRHLHRHRTAGVDLHPGTSVGNTKNRALLS